MRNPQSSFDWQFCNQRMDDQVWQAIMQPAAAVCDAPAQKQVGWDGHRSLRSWPYLALLAIIVTVLGWYGSVLTAAPRASVGQPSTLPPPIRSPVETTLFRIYFDPQYAAAVQMLAVDIDQRYEKIQREFGLVLPVGADKMVIRVGFPITTGGQAGHPVPQDNIVIPQVALWMPGKFGQADSLARYTSNWLAGRAVERLVQRRPIRPEWHPLVNGFRHYFGLQQDGGLGVRLVDEHELQAWRSIPGLPGRRADPVRTTYGDEMLTKTNRPNPEISDGQSMVSILFADYLLTTYGRQHLATLFADLNHHESWETLSLAVYGISAHELDAGWRTYLETLSDLLP
jgi:hypothetical protein